MLTVYKVGEQDRRVVEEFQRKPVGHHSPELQRVLNVFRSEPLAGKYVLICTVPHREWRLAQLSGERGKPVKELDVVFTDLGEAERAVFQLRWKKFTGSEL